MRAVLWMLSTSTLLSISSVSVVANAKGPLDQCTSYHCLYKNIVKNRDKNYTEDACKSLDGKISRPPSNQDMGKLCRL